MKSPKHPQMDKQKDSLHTLAGAKKLTLEKSPADSLRRPGVGEVQNCLLTLNISTAKGVQCCPPHFPRSNGAQILTEEVGWRDAELPTKTGLFTTRPSPTLDGAIGLGKKEKASILWLAFLVS